MASLEEMKVSNARFYFCQLVKGKSKAQADFTKS